MADKTIADELRVAYDERYWCSDLLKDAATVIDELLAACEATHAWLTDIERGGHHLDNPLPTQLRAAIAKAKGDDMENEKTTKIETAWTQFRALTLQAEGWEVVGQGDCRGRPYFFMWPPECGA